MEKNTTSWVMSFCLGLILSFSTLLMFPIILVCSLILAPSNTLAQIIIYFAALFLLGMAAGLTIIWKKCFGFREYHTVVPFITLTVLCAQDIFGLNSAAVVAVINRKLSDFFPEFQGKLKIGLCFSIPLTAAILLTLLISALVKRIREKSLLNRH